MTKRKPARSSKHSYRIATKAQRATQAIVRSPKASVSRPVEADSNKQASPHENYSQQDALFFETPELVVENVETALQNAKQITENDSKKGIDFLSSANAKVRAYQDKLLEIAQANMQFAFEFAQRLTAVRSPLEFPSVIAEYTSKRLTMFRKHSAEIAELSMKQ